VPITPLAVAVAASGCALALTLGWRGSDLPSHVFRADLVRREGFIVWNNQWYGGHGLLPYSVLTPLLAAVIGPLVVGAVASVVGAGLFARIVDTAFGRAGRAAAVWFAAASVANLAVGRIAYAVGVTFGLAAVLAIQHNRPLAVFAAAAACSLSSPLAGAFLALVALAVFVADRRRRITAGTAGLGAAAPIVLLAVLFPGGGRQPYSPGALAWDLLLAGALAVAARDIRVLRIGAVLYAATALAVFAVPNPVGGNVSRLAQYVVGPLLVALGPGRRALGALLAGLLVWCQWLPAVDTFAFARTDPSTRAGYYTGVVAYLSTQSGPPGRVEIPFTARHWESAYAARDLVLARGWERQLDTELHPIFYGEDLDATTYRRWLTDNGVAYVALPDVPLDRSARSEARLLRAGVPGLRPVWHDPHWRVWRVEGFRGLTEGPATVAALEPDRVLLDVYAPGTALLRVRASSRWALDGPGCAAATAGGWTLLRNLRPGRIVLRPALRASRCPG